MSKSFEDAIKISFEVHRLLDAVWEDKKTNLNKFDFHFLYKIYKLGNGEKKLSEIKNHIKKSFNYKGFKKMEIMFSKKLTKLETNGYIKRIKDLKDRRERIIVLTDEGISFIQKLEKECIEKWDARKE